MSVDDLAAATGTRSAFQTALMDAIESAVVATDTQGVVTFWNRSAERMFGWSAHEAIGRSIVDLMEPEDGRPAASDIVARLRVGERWSGEYLVRRRDGSLLPIDAVAAPIRGTGGELLGTVVISADATERRWTEAARQLLAEAGKVLTGSLEYEEILQAIARMLVPDLADLCIVDVVEADDSVRRVAAETADPDKREPLEELRRGYPPIAGSLQPAARAIATGCPDLANDLRDEDLIARARDEQHATLLRRLGVRAFLAVPMIARGRTIGAITLALTRSTRRYGDRELDLVRDLAERCALAVDNARLYRDAREAVRLRDEFLSIAAHELRTPVTSLRGYSQLTLAHIQRTGSLERERIEKTLDVVDRQSRRLTALVNQLLDTSRIDNGTLAIDRREVDLVSLADDVIGRLRALYPQRTLRLEAPTSVVAEVDPLRLEQVLTNLVDNAVKFSPHGAEVDVVVRSEDDRAVVAVNDRGEGVKPEHRKKIFERFYQASGQRHYGGMGLGLFVSRQIIELHGGGIDVESREGGGSSFVVRLPLSAAGSA